MAKKKRDFLEQWEEEGNFIRHNKPDRKRFDKKKRRIQEARKRKAKEKYSYLDS